MTHPLFGRKGAGALALLVAVMLPLLSGDRYLLHVASLIGTYWVLIIGLNLIVGYMGQLSVGHVGLFAIGAYTVAIGSGVHGLSPELALVIAGVLGALCGFVLGVPSLRLPGFYFAMTTLGLSLIVGEVLVAQRDVTGGGAGLPVPGFSGPLATPSGLYLLVVGVAALISLVSWNITRLMWGRAMVSIRDSSVAAAAIGVPAGRVKLTLFTFSGFTAGVAGALFGALQSYVTPETFHFDLGLFFFICIVIGGKGSILGPFLGTVVLTLLPEVSASFAVVGHFLYALVLLFVVLLVPDGISSVLRWLIERFWPRPNPPTHRQLDLPLLASALRSPGS